jgi:hypothetical protein
MGCLREHWKERLVSARCENFRGREREGLVVKKWGGCLAALCEVLTSA